MQRRVLAGLSVITLIAGCGGGSGETATTPSPAEQPSELEVSQAMVDIADYCGATRSGGEASAQQLAEYEEAIDVMIALGSEGRLEEKIGPGTGKSAIINAAQLLHFSDCDKEASAEILEATPGLHPIDEAP